MKPQKNKRLLVIGSLVLLILLSCCVFQIISKYTSSKTSLKTPTQAVITPPFELTRQASLTLQQEERKWISEIKKLCLQVNQSYTGMENQNEPIAEEIKSILERIGVTTTIGESGDCQAILKITLEMTPVGESVTGAQTTCYYEATAKGSASLSLPGEPELSLDLQRIYSPYSRVVFSCPSRESVDFSNAWGYALVPMLKEWWGAPGLISALRSQNLWLADEATRQLPEMGAEAQESISSLVEMLKDSDPTIRGMAVDTLGEFGPEAAQAVPNLLEMINDPDLGVKFNTIEALGKIGDARALPVLEELLNNEDKTTRITALEALGHLKEKAVPAIPGIEKALKDQDYEVVQAAISALTWIGVDAKEAVPALIDVVKGENALVVPQAVNALETITGQKFGKDAAAWSQWWEENK